MDLMSLPHTLQFFLECFTLGSMLDFEGCNTLQLTKCPQMEGKQIYNPSNEGQAIELDVNSY
jgi:hypothetical protein